MKLKVGWLIGTLLATGLLLGGPGSARAAATDLSRPSLYSYDALSMDQAPAAPSVSDLAVVAAPGLVPDTGYFYDSSRYLDATNTADELLALPGRQVDAAWGVNTYRHGGTMTTIEHIDYRHAWDSGFSNVSRFAERTSARQIRDLVDEALRYGTVSENGTSVLWDADRALGVDAAGNAATGLQV